MLLLSLSDTETTSPSEIFAKSQDRTWQNWRTQWLLENPLGPLCPRGKVAGYVHMSITYLCHMWHIYYCMNTYYRSTHALHILLYEYHNTINIWINIYIYINIHICVCMVFSYKSTHGQVRAKDRNGVKNLDTLVPQWMGFMDVPSQKKKVL